jgi:hypothetical protein
MINVFEELDKFSNIKFHKEGHLYYINGKNAISATSLINRYKKKFDEDFWSKKKAEERKITQEQILMEWKEKRESAEIKGTKVHDYIENYLSNKVYPFYGTQFESTLKHSHPVKKAFDKIVPLVNRFCADIKGKMIPIKSEVVVGDEEFLISGTIDQIFFNKKADKLELWDWKTNKEIKSETPYKLEFPLSHISNAELHIYSLQLSLYKYLIQKNTNLEIGDCYINWFNENNKKYKIFKCFDFENEIKSIIMDYQEKK